MIKSEHMTYAPMLVVNASKKPILDVRATIPAAYKIQGGRRISIPLAYETTGAIPLCK